MELKKAVILAAGEGQRLLPITKTRPKHLIPLAGKPLIQYTIEYLKKAGIHEILLVVGYLKEQIIDYFKDGTDFGIKIEYIEQKEFLGTAHATNLSKNFVGNEPFMLIYGDLLMDESIFSESISLYNELGEGGLICLFRVPDPQKFGIIKLDNSEYVKKIVEKPEDERYGNLANAAVYIFDSKVFDGIQRTQKSKRGEYELTDSMQILINEGYKIKGFDISGKYWCDIGHPWQLLDANHHLLDKMEPANDGTIEKNVSITGDVHIGKGTIIKSGTYIEGPVYIGNNCSIGPNSYIRPYSSIGNSVKIGNSSELKNTIIMNKSYMSHLSYSGDSIICENVNFGCGSVISNVRLDKGEVYMNIKGKKTATGKKKLGTVIGDNVQLGINALIMVGTKIGVNSYIGPGTIADEDVPDNTIFYIKQQKIIKRKLK